MEVPAGAPGRCFLGHPLDGVIVEPVAPEQSNDPEAPAPLAVPAPSVVAPSAAPEPAPEPAFPLLAPAASTGFVAPRPLGELVAEAASAGSGPAMPLLAPQPAALLVQPLVAQAPVAQPAASVTTIAEPTAPATNLTPVSGTAALDPEPLATPQPNVTHDLFVVGGDMGVRKFPMPPRKVLMAAGGVVIVLLGYFGMKMMAGSAPAKPASAPAVPVQMNLVRSLSTGAASTYHVKLAVKATFTMQSRTQSTQLTGDTDVTERVLSKAADGSATLRYTLGNVTFFANGVPLHDPGSVSLDVTLNPDGSVRGVGAQPAGGEFVSLVSPVLPAHVASGMTWKRVDSQPFPLLGISSTMTTVFKVLDLDASAATLSASTSGVLAAHVGAKELAALTNGSPPPGAPSLDMRGRVSGHGTQTVDRASGQTTAAHQVTSITLTIPSAGAGAARLVISVRTDLSRTGVKAPANAA